MYNYYQPQPFLKGRAITSPDEVKIAPVDMDGTVSYYPDLANKKIYTKQINRDGTATINIYELKNTEEEKTAFVTREEFDKSIKELKSLLVKQEFKF